MLTTRNSRPLGSAKRMTENELCQQPDQASKPSGTFFEVEMTARINRTITIRVEASDIGQATERATALQKTGETRELWKNEATGDVEAIFVSMVRPCTE